MSETPPATLLREAATRIRQLGAHYADYDDWRETRFESQHDQWRYWAIDREIRGTDMARWIAAFSPALAEPLALWLEDEADRWDVGFSRRDIANALAFARTLLASQSAPTEETP